MDAGSPAELGTNLFGHGAVRCNRVVLPRLRGGTTGWQTGAHSCRRANGGENAQADPTVFRSGRAGGYVGFMLNMYLLIHLFQYLFQDRSIYENQKSVFRVPLFFLPLPGVSPEERRSPF